MKKTPFLQLVIKGRLNNMNWKKNSEDVTFCVGRKKEKIHVLSVSLKDACPYIDELFRSQWAVWNPAENQQYYRVQRWAKTGKYYDDDEGIPIPEVDPEIFKMFLELLLSDDWSLAQIIAMQMPNETYRDLIEIAERFHAEKILQKLDPLRVQLESSPENLQI